MNEWTKYRIDSLIADAIEESLVLDYKASGSLKKKDAEKKEVTKDVSAMANSAGGTIVYGIKEDAVDRHRPGGLDPINRKEISKEWLDQVIGNIQPRIGNVTIHSVEVGPGPDDVVYVVEVQQSLTAHQASDMRYYYRYNFESVAMSDYQIRDVMARGSHPQIELDFAITLDTVTYKDPFAMFGRASPTFRNRSLLRAYPKTW